MNQELDILKTYFGYSSFRPGQQELIRAILHGRDVLGILPTGGGKSICYQVPALLLPGLTIVVSPLLSLMRDQVEALVRRGIPAAAVTSELTAGERRDVYRRASGPPRPDRLRLLYLSPERLMTEEFRSACRSFQISLLCVDEAHCISLWGSDFRPSYRRIRDFLALLPRRPVVAALTATATERVRADILRELSLLSPHLTLSTFDRPNLYYEVRHPQSKREELFRLLSRYGSRAGIVYCLTRRTVDAVARRLNGSGIPAARYHAGMDLRERVLQEELWLRGRKPLMVATNAFGMGIDKPDVRFVIHYQMPGSIENYYQEAGRAGRDGKPADCILLYSDADVRICRFFIAGTRRREQRVAMTSQLDAMRRYAGGHTCLRRALLTYFGEDSSLTGTSCRHCSVCLGRSVHASSLPSGAEDSALFSSLSSLRKRLAGEHHCQAWQILSNEALHDLATLRPEHMRDLLLMEQIPLLKGIQYGADFLLEIRAWNASH